jgi:hypothetical protein
MLHQSNTLTNTLTSIFFLGFDLVIMSGVAQFPPAHLIPEEGETQTTQQSSQPLSLPAPPTNEEKVTFEKSVKDDDSIVKFDNLGPMVVNSDGTISRIHNWQTMNDAERERTARLVNKRNQTRLQALRESAVNDISKEQIKINDSDP